jgi:hypothetical protein
LERAKHTIVPSPPKKIRKESVDVKRPTVVYMTGKRDTWLLYGLTCRLLSLLKSSQSKGGNELMKCQRCKEETDEVFRVKLHGRTKKVCEECLEIIREEEEIAAEAEGAMQSMMEYKGR